MARLGWYEKYIGYEFADGTEGVILQDVFKFQDGNRTATGYELFYPKTGETKICDYATFKEIAHQTNLPR